MNILAIECSQAHASVCLSKNGESVFCSDWTAARNHDEHLFPALAQALEKLAAEPLHLILVGVGPGSYGGVRVALAAAVGLSTVKHSRMVAIGSWDDLAADNGACIVADARRGGWTLRRPDGNISVVTSSELQQEAANGALLFSTESEQTMLSAGISAVRCNVTPTAEGLIRSWLALSTSQQEELAAKPAEPIYVRPPHITEAKHKPWEIKKQPKA